MPFDLSPIFAKYEELQKEVDAIFNKVKTLESSCVTCKKGCNDCCHATFDLSFIESIYINTMFEKTFDYGPIRSSILEKANKIDRDLTKLKKDLYYAEKNGEQTEEIMKKAAKIRIKCPLLDDNNLCVLYEYRPITCRLYGIPTEIAGQAHVCGYSGFKKGQNYPTVHLDKIHAKLDEMSLAIGKHVKSKFTKLDEVYVPLSMALLTNYDDRYLGIENK